LSKVIQNKFLDKLEETEREEAMMRNNGVAIDEEIPSVPGNNRLTYCRNMWNIAEKPLI
jgi:hypothetical protein